MAREVFVCAGRIAPPQLMTTIITAICRKVFEASIPKILQKIWAYLIEPDKKKLKSGQFRPSAFQLSELKYKSGSKLDSSRLIEIGEVARVPENEEIIKIRFRTGRTTSIEQVEKFSPNFKISSLGDPRLFDNAQILGIKRLRSQITEGRSRRSQKACRIGIISRICRAADCCRSSGISRRRGKCRRIQKTE